MESILNEYIYFLPKQMNGWYKFVNPVGRWMIDLIELNDSPYVKINYQTRYIFFAYNPSNHIIFTKFTKTKDTESTTKILDEFLNYLDKND